ncbi:MAG: diaminobutyrate acetyltransferase [Myxococcota bacterium]
MKILDSKEMGPDAPVEALAARRVVRPPRLRDGVGVHDLIRDCPPLDPNSLYCNLLQCTHFADTCAIAVDVDEAGRETVVGWLSAYRPPSEPETLFVWQVAVAPVARRTGLAHRMLEAILRRPACRGVERVGASVTEDNVASLGFFERFARRHGSRIERTPWFDADEAFQSRHASEYAIRIEDVRVAGSDAEERIAERPAPVRAVRGALMNEGTKGGSR